MSGLWEVYRFECRHQLRSPLFLIVAGVFFLLTFAGMASESVSIGGSDAALNLNSNYAIIQTHLIFSIIGMFAAIAFVASAITRDYDLKTTEVFYATGITPRAFVLGRFLGGFTFALGAGTAGLLGTLTATFMPWLDVDRIGAFSADVYLYVFTVILLPNYFLVCAGFFCAAALLRSMGAAYAAALVAMVAYIVLGQFAGPEDLWWSVYADPFGSTALFEALRYATVYERNYSLPGGDIAGNRLLWVGVGFAFLIYTVMRYRFEFTRRTGAAREKRIQPAPVFAARPVVTLEPDVLRAQLYSQIRMDIRGVLHSVPFYVVLVLGIFNVLGGFFGSTSLPYDTNSYPVTAVMLQAISGSFLFFVLMLLVYYAGEMVYRERDSNIADILDATPYSNVVMVASKILALWFIVTLLLTVVMIASILVQLFLGYTNIEPGLYLTGLFGVLGGSFYLLAVLGVFLAVLAGNRWTGMLALVVLFLCLNVAASFGFEHNLYLFNVPGAPYSDMNGYGHYAAPVFWFTLYWAFFCLVLVGVAHLLFPRGRVVGLGERIRVAGERASAGVLSMMGIAAVLCLATGAYIFYNTNVLNEYRTADDIEAVQADYEKAYRKYWGMPLPQVDNLTAEVDIYPETRRLESRGTIVLSNRTDAPLEEVVMTIEPTITLRALELDGAEVAQSDEAVGHYLYRFEPALQPGQTTEARWHLSWINDGFPNARPNNRVVANGTFVDTTEIFPGLGYAQQRELQDNAKRREHDLPPLERMPKLGDPAWLSTSQFGVSQRTGFDITVSTAADQIAISPGYLQKEWMDEGRRYFHYKMDEPIWPFASISSARYEVARDQWNDVALEVYFDAKHPYNVDVMMRSAKRSLDYFSKQFSPYQYRQFRVLEFPRYASFAQSFPNTVPYSEAIGFITDVTDPEDIDLVFYVTAHEMAHQWWGHQVAGALMQGATVIVETLAQYSALMVMEQEYGRAQMRRFLKFELDRYLSSRGGELIEELPLMLTENQPYIHYRKGSVVLYALKEAIGEPAVNQALRNFLEKYAYQKPPFPTAADLVAEFRAVAEPGQQQLITDLFEKITLYDLQVKDVQIEPHGERYRVQMNVDAAKFYADGEGRETEAPFEQMVDVAIFPAPAETLGDNELPVPILLEKHLIRSGSNTLSFEVDELPHQVGVDPYIHFIDRNPGDNLKQI